MRTSSSVAIAVLAGIAFGSPLWGDESIPSHDTIKAAINKAIPQLEAGSKGSAEQRQCFTCHSQAVPILALAEVRRQGFSIDQDNFDRQLKHTAAHLERGKDNYQAGAGQGGKVLTAGYALWTLETGGATPDDTTAAVAHFLLEYQKDQTHWSHPGNRPPSSGSKFTTTYVALRGLATFGTEQQKPLIESRRKQIADWLLTETPHDTEDHVFRLWTMPYIDASEEAIRKATEDLIRCQQDDGGWAQSPDMKSDPYATASVLVALLHPGKVSANHDAVQRGMRYLLSAQLDDGSWHVATRAKPFQPYFESGFPHGKDQFISIAATGWATLALALSLPASPPVEGTND